MGASGFQHREFSPCEPVRAAVRLAAMQDQSREAIMTEPPDMHGERDTDAMTADREPEVRPEVIKDLDVTGDDADVWSGCSLQKPMRSGNDRAARLRADRETATTGRSTASLRKRDEGCPGM
jgi:hypothetical protein